MTDPQLPWDFWFIYRGVQVLAVLTFVGFFCWAIMHLVHMFNRYDERD